MHRKIAVSLVIPTYNRAALVCETIASALAQTVPFSEIIVVDDGSTDDTLNDLRRFGDKIKVAAKGKIGLQAARNAGAGIATSEYLTFCDSDDLLQPEFLATVSGWLASQASWESVYVNYRSFSASGLEGDILANAPSGFLRGAQHAGRFITHVPDLYARTMHFQPLLASGATVAKAFFDAIGGFNPAINGIASEDWEYTLRAVGFGRTAICTEPLVKIRRHAGNQSRNILRQVLGEVEIIKFALANHSIAEKYRSELTDAIFRRRHRVFYESFQQKRLNLAALVFPFLKDGPHTIGFQLKACVVRIYLLFFQPDAEKLLGFPISPDQAIHQSDVARAQPQAAPWEGIALSGSAAAIKNPET